MQIGDLVKPRIGGSSLLEPFDVIGVIVEWEPDYSETEGCGWVRWSRQPDFNIEYEEDLEVISESK